MSVLQFRPARPRVNEETEKQLEGIEQKSAACYTDMERNSVRLRRLAESISASDAAPVPVEDEGSAVHHIDEARTRTRT